MPEEKRTYHSEVVQPGTMRLEPANPGYETTPGPLKPNEPRKQFLSVELIVRLTERIKKL